MAQYLNRDLATVRRWEKTRGLPIHRVGLTGRSVFANTLEIDQWLNTGPRDASRQIAVPMPTPVVAFRAYRWWMLMLTAVVLAAAITMYARARRTASTELRVVVTSAGVSARDPAGVERWRYPFPADYLTDALPQTVQITRGPHAGFFFATFRRERQLNGEVEGGTLTFLDLDGRVQRSFSFADEVTFAGKSYGQPWGLTDFAVDKGTGRVAVAAHHYTWDPGLVTILDDQWQRRGTFVHAGWIEQVRWLTPDRLLIGGFSNARDGGMIALLDAAALNGQGPEPIGTRHFCENCGTDQPLRMFVFPRTEVNRAATARFNRAVLLTFASGKVVAASVEMLSKEGDATVLYEFAGPSLNLVSARFSDRYWDMHRALEAEGKIKHTRAQCPDRDGPRQILAWEPASGWKTVHIR